MCSTLILTPVTLPVGSTGSWWLCIVILQEMRVCSGSSDTALSEFSSRVKALLHGYNRTFFRDTYFGSLGGVVKLKGLSISWFQWKYWQRPVAPFYTGNIKYMRITRAALTHKNNTTTSLGFHCITVPCFKLATMWGQFGINSKWLCSKCILRGFSQ